MKFATYLINLDHATERMQQMDTQLQGLEIPYARVAAVLGAKLVGAIPGFDETGYKIRTGKYRNTAEIGCHFSHMKAMEAFLESDHSHALILEDDAQLPANLIAILESAIGQNEQWDLLRLSSSRKGDYINIATLIEDYSLVINTRVLKNTAAYMINRKAAERCLKYLRPMRWPYDVALDRDWSMDIQTACVHPFPVTFDDVPGQIPKARRARILRATTYHICHTIDHFRRHLYRRQVAKRLISDL